MFCYLKSPYVQTLFPTDFCNLLCNGKLKCVSRWNYHHMQHFRLSYIMIWKFVFLNTLRQKKISRYRLQEKYNIKMKSVTFTKVIVIIQNRNQKSHPDTAWKVSKYGVFLVLIFPYSDWIQRFTQQNVPYFYCLPALLHP